jgi:hypothetical protein
LIEEKRGHRVAFVNPANAYEVIDLWTPCTTILKRAYAAPIILPNDVRVPTLEIALAMKYASSIGAGRPMECRYQDAADLANIYCARSDKIDVDVLRQLGDLARPLGGTRLIRWLRRLNTGKKVRLPN